MLNNQGTKPKPVPEKIRVFLVDDHPIVRRGLRMLLSREPDLLPCGEADSAPAALQQILALKPHAAIVDLSFETGTGLGLIKQIRAQGLKTKLGLSRSTELVNYALKWLQNGPIDHSQTKP